MISLPGRVNAAHLFVCLVWEISENVARIGVGQVFTCWVGSECRPSNVHGEPKEGTGKHTSLQRLSKERGRKEPVLQSCLCFLNPLTFQVGVILPRRYDAIVCKAAAV